MAYINQNKFRSAFMYRKSCMIGNELLRKQTSLPKRKHSSWQDFWLATISVTDHTQSLSDTIGGATNIAY